MKPVFKEEREYLGISDEFENMLWVDKRCYYAFDKSANKIKFGRNIDKIKIKNIISGYMTHDEYCKHHYETITQSRAEQSRAKKIS